MPLNDHDGIDACANRAESKNEQLTYRLPANMTRSESDRSERCPSKFYGKNLPKMATNCNCFFTEKSVPN